MSELRDERIVATAQRWGAWGLLMLWFLLITDLMVRTLIFKQEPRQWLDIAAIWMGTATFVSIGMAASGVAPYGGKWS